MSRNNDVFQTLVTKGNQAPLAGGSSLSALSPGQVGVFDFNSNLSIAAEDTPKDFYLAVGLDPLNTGSLTDVLKSRGSHIQGKNTVFYNYREYNSGQAMKVVLKDYTANCDTEYGIKLELRNQEIYRSQGYNQFTKTYTVTTACCDGCEPTCPSGDANEVTNLLKATINNDPSGLVSAVAIARQAIVVATHSTSTAYAVGEEVSDEDITAIMAFNATQEDASDYIYTDLEISTVTQAINSFCNVNLQYFYPRETFVVVTKLSGDLAGGFNCTGSVETTQPAVFEEGAAYDIKQKEYQARGWDASPYRLSTLNGVAKDITYLAVDGEKYDQVALTYDQHSLSGWEDFLANQATCIAIPTEDTDTRDGLLEILDGIMTAQNFPSSGVVSGGA